jgi:uncharacterized protein (TIGR00730 family)
MTKPAQPGTPAPSVAVFCSAQDHPEWGALAFELGREIARRGAALVYGGGSAGLMGAVARGAAELSEQITGIAPQGLFVHERSDRDPGRQYVVADMHTRKQRLYAAADAFIVLPGGLGTMSEFWESVEWSQLGLHIGPTQKPAVLLNWGGLYTGLLDLLSAQVEAGLLKQVHRDLIHDAETAAEALDALGIYEPREEAPAPATAVMTSPLASQPPAPERESAA